MKRLIQIAASTCGLWGLLTQPASASVVGYTNLPATESSTSVSVFYPASDGSRPETFGGIEVRVATDVPPVAGNRRLIIISPGSGAPPWVYFDLTKQLVEQGYVVAMPEHVGDNENDHRNAGPASWKLRPLEVSEAIDRVAHDSRFAASIDFSKVGMYGMSAGGHTALTLAGGRWSPSRLKAHCEAHAAEDFQACAGPLTRLHGNWLDAIKIRLVKWVDGLKFNDDRWFTHTDARIAAIVSGVPFAADFDPESLRSPHVPLGLIAARHDLWLNPSFHSDVIAHACTHCVILDEIEHGGHGALLSPLPPQRTGVVAELIADPPDFDRSTEVPKINQSIVDFFNQNLAVSRGPQANH